MANISEVMHDERDFPDPFEFKPERYLDAASGHFRPHPKVIPFGLGKRRCLGERLARESVYCFFVSLLHRFSLEKANPSAELTTEPVVGVTLSPKHFEVKMIPRDD